MDFTDIIGHEKQIKSLKNSIKNGTISHSYIFEGEEGLGKRTVAYVFSKTLLCEKGQDEPCNTCSSCIKFDTFNHPDFNIISPTNNTIKREEIDRLIKDISTMPFESNRKIYIIDDCHTLRLDSQNILLKTLEEPPEYVTIILITSEKEKIISTILSRCQSIKFYSLENSKIVDLLVEEHNVEINRAKFIASFSKGSLKKSLELANSSDFFNMRGEIIEIIDSLLRGDRIKALTSLDFFNENKENTEEILDIMVYWFRDLLILKETGNTDLLINKDMVERLSNQTFVDLNRINDIIYRIDETKINIKRNVNFNLLIETMLLSI
ncbi:MAG: DNA polymerase III subunit delta' [Tissierellia bacterium]|nr:DNA polymerase III subunit delta' [Tissierellia bacterium]